MVPELERIPVTEISAEFSIKLEIVTVCLIYLGSSIPGTPTLSSESFQVSGDNQGPFFTVLKSPVDSGVGSVVGSVVGTG